MARNSDFGKDLGLVHEAVVTGREAGADTAFWAGLAHSKKAFEAVIPLVKHIALMERYNLDLKGIVTDKTPDLEEWLGVLGVYCVTCFGPNPEDFGRHPLPKEAEDRERTRQSHEMRQQFFISLCDSIKRMGILPVELCAVLEHWREMLPEEREQHFSFPGMRSETDCVAMEGQDCVPRGALVHAVRIIFNQRRYLAGRT
ncbi:MAG: hypothetical protein AAB916_02095 [Patescibacteria group bacterium]